ncbi:MAG: class I SAM-dependent methyltransferase [Candidatus Omnitrophota bacterium]|nr:class I SAM-dependent methyltransferase [Candidatus Omnitrophota bacterium]
MRPYNDEAGDWRGLDSESEAPRYAAIAQALRDFRVDRNVLDVGCGMAVLRSYLPGDANYTGIEPSTTAVRMAVERNASVRIIHSRAERFDAPGGFFDSVVFNEMLYYTLDPVGLLRKYASLLRRDGVILCSIYQNPSSLFLRRRLWHWLDRRRPISCIHCEKMVRAFMTRENWSILDDRSVGPAGGSSKWHIWLAAPPRSRPQES